MHAACNEISSFLLLIIKNKDLVIHFYTRGLLPTRTFLAGWSINKAVTFGK